MSLNNIDEDNKNPYFIIVAGPNASGKSTLINKVSNYINNDDLLNKNKTEFISVDDYIEKNPFFVSEVNNFFKKNFKNKKNEIYNEFLYPSKKTIIFFNKIYWETRKNTDCITGNKLNKNKNKTQIREKNYKTCGEIISNNILNALKQKKNIIFETTGITFPFWIFKQYPNDLINYNLIISWSIVDICDLYNRNKFRTLSTLKAFMEMYTNASAPRLPDIRKKNYKRSLISIIETFKLLVNYHGNRALSKLRLLLFDNRGIKNKNLYDSYKNSNKKGYDEILKYNVNNNCDNISPSKKSSSKLSPIYNDDISPSKKSSSKLSPLSSNDISPSKKSSSKLSPLSSNDISPSKKSTSILSPLSSNNISPSKKSTSKLSPLSSEIKKTNYSRIPQTRSQTIKKIA